MSRTDQVGREAKTARKSVSSAQSGHLRELVRLVEPEKLKESRRFVLELPVHFLDARECLVGFRKVLFCNTSNHAAALSKYEAECGILSYIIIIIWPTL